MISQYAGPRLVAFQRHHISLAILFLWSWIRPSGFELISRTQATPNTEHQMSPEQERYLHDFWLDIEAVSVRTSCWSFSPKANLFRESDDERDAGDIEAVNFTPINRDLCTC